MIYFNNDSDENNNFNNGNSNRDNIQTNFLYIISKLLPDAENNLFQGGVNGTLFRVGCLV